MANEAALQDHHHLQALLDHIGIGSSGNEDVTLMELMSFTLQCLGGVRVMVTKREKRRLARVSVEGNYPACVREEADEAIRAVFSSAISRFVGPIKCARPLQDLDPSRHLVESFPNHESLFSNQWLMIHWAVLGNAGVEEGLDGKPVETLCTPRDVMTTAGVLPSQSISIMRGARSVCEMPSRCVTALSSSFKAAMLPVICPPASHPKLSTGVEVSGNSNLYADRTQIEGCSGRISDCGPSASTASDRINLIERIASTYEDAVAEVDKEGRSALHYAARLDSIELLQTVAKYSETKDIGYNFINLNGAMPLHNTARFSRSPTVMEYVVSVLPAASFVGNNNGTVPLHWAAAKNTKLEVLNALLVANPEAVRTPDKEGSLPLHSAGQNTFLHIVKVIFSANPEAISKRDSEGGVPLHHACCFNSNLEVVKFMYEAYPEGMALAQLDGIMPIHLAASQNASADVMRFILLKCPASAFAVDGHGWLPLHCLIDNDPLDMTASRIESLRLLLRANPGAVLHRNRDGRSALDHARFRHHSEYVIRAMLLACPEADPVELARLNWSSHRRHAIMSCVYLGTRQQNDSIFRVQDSATAEQQEEEEEEELAVAPTSAPVGEEEGEGITVTRSKNSSGSYRTTSSTTSTTVAGSRGGARGAAAVGRVGYTSSVSSADTVSIFTLLCRDGMSESGYQVESYTLRHIIKFL